MFFVRGLSLVSLFAACLLMAAPGCGKKNEPGGANAKEHIKGKWEHKAGDLLITLEFTGDKVDGKWKKDGSGPSINSTYTVGENTVEMMKFGGAGEEKVKIEEITKDKLVLSGFSHKEGKFEFARPGLAAKPNSELILGKWKMEKKEKFGGDKDIAMTMLVEFSKDGKLKMDVNLGEPFNKDMNTAGKFKFIDETTLETNVPKPGQKDPELDKMKIETLTDSKLVLSTEKKGKGNKMETEKLEFKRQ